MRQSLTPMAVPLEQPGPSKAAQLVALGALALALAGLWGQEQVIAVTRVALDGLRSSEAYVVEIDAADLPAMDPGLARIVDPRARPVSQVAMRTRQVAVQPFEYDVRAGETLQEIATRFGTDVSAILWNNGLDSADQVTVGARLTVLPVRGVLHLVRPDETLAAIAERYGSRLEDLILANALERADAVAPGQVIVGTRPGMLSASSTSVSVTLPSLTITKSKRI
jgi:LysM repeat protein